MSDHTSSLAVRETALFSTPLRTRIPFRYGIATLTEVPHLFVRATVEINGRVQDGIAADSLPPKWFTKDPAARFEDEIADMLAVIRHACAGAKASGTVSSPFALWSNTYEAQRVWAAQRKFPPLLWGFGVSLIERACLDAFCRATAASLADAVRSNLLGVQLRQIHPELEDAEPSAFLSREPLRTLIARHTVGLGDPLTEEEIPDEERVSDGLPQALEACMARYGLTHFKIKLSGDIERDRSRLRRIADLIQRHTRDFAFTLDGNENYRAVEPFRVLWEELSADAAIKKFLERLLFVEQPLHRDAALSGSTADELRAWKDRPPMIIDESDAEPDSVRRALSAGYAGTSHKNCKGVFRGIANACLIAHRRAMQPGRRFEISAEDLVNVGPVALLQDLAVVATLGISHVERNGHHYFPGLQQFPAEVQQQVCAAHPDLYEMQPAGFPTLRIKAGRLNVGSVADAPFGTGFELDVSRFERLAD